MGVVPSGGWEPPLQEPVPFRERRQRAGTGACPDGNGLPLARPGVNRGEKSGASVQAVDQICQDSATPKGEDVREKWAESEIP